jgi:hypothetical protein
MPKPTPKRKSQGFQVISASSHPTEAEAIERLTKSKLQRLGFGKTAETTSIRDVAGHVSSGIRSVSSVTPSSDEPATEPLPVPTPVPTPTPQPQPQPVAAQAPVVMMSPEQLQSLINSSVQTAITGVESRRQAEVAQVQTQADQRAADIQAQVVQAQADLQAAQARTAQLEALWKPQGGGTVDMTVRGEGSAEMRNYESLVNKAPKARVEDSRFGTAVQMDIRAVDEYYRKNRVAIREGLEATLRAKGFLQGGFGGISDTQAMTLASDIPSIAFQYLSSFIRESHYSDLIHWQFASNTVELGRQPGLNIAVPRYPYMAKPTSLADRQLTPGASIDPATNPVNELFTTITLLELGLGKDAANAPLGFSNFIQAYSIANLESLVERNLGRDYAATKDLYLLTRWFETDRIIYNAGNNVTTDPLQVVPGGKGTLTDTFLINLRAHMKTLLIPTYLDGNYGLVCNPNSLAQYMITQNTKTIEPGYNIVTTMLQQATNQDFGGVVSGYRGLWHGFHLFEQNSYGVGAPGEVGTQTVTFGTGVGARVADTNFAFGRDTVAWCTGMAAEVRLDEVSDFRRRSRMLWTSHENSGRLDVKFTAGTGEQLRVLQFRNARAEV